MTLLQNTAIFTIGVVIEIFIVIVTAIHSEEDGQNEFGIALLNALALAGILLAWANGIKFPLK